MYKIMIVDDDSTSLAIARALLEKEYHLTLVHSGMQALGFLKGDDLPDLILLDMAMPGLNGMEVLKSLKESALLKEIPVVILTGEGDTKKEIESYRIGAADFLQKPVNADMLRIKLRQQFEAIGLKRENQKLKAALGEIKDQVAQLFSELSEIEEQRP